MNYTANIFQQQIQQQQLQQLSTHQVIPNTSTPASLQLDNVSLLEGLEVLSPLDSICVQHLTTEAKGVQKSNSLVSCSL